MAKVMVKPLHLYGEFTNVERKGNEYIVEGYVYVNETCPGEGGIRIKRSAMEAATPEYMRFANLREMHDKTKASGVAQWATWDEKGCKVRYNVVDPVAISKVEAGVYKGFSIGIQPTVVRGRDVDVLRWLETSLVDRPRDADAVFTTFRAEGVDEGYAGAECDLLPEELDVERNETPNPDPLPEPGPPAPADPGVPDPTPTPAPDPGPEPVAEPTPLAAPEPEAAAEAGGPPAEAEPEGVERGQDSTTVPVRENLEGACKKCAAVCRACHPEERSEEPTPLEPLAPGETLTPHPDTLLRLEALEAEGVCLLTRAETAEAEIVRVQAALSVRDGELLAARERIERLEKEPVPVALPITNASGVEREFLVNRRSAQDQALAAKAQELAVAVQERPTDAGAQAALATRINRLKSEIAALA